MGERMNAFQWIDGQERRNGPFADLHRKPLDLLMRVSAYYLVRSGFSLTCEVLTALPSPAKLLFLVKARWEIPAVFSGVL